MKKIKPKFIILSLLIVYLFVFSDIGVISRIRLNQKITLMEKKIIRLKKENRNLKVVVERLKSDREYLAGIARKLGYAGKGEKIYRFYEEAATNSPLIRTNIRLSFWEKVKFRNVFVYLAVFILVSALYLYLLFSARKNRASVRNGE